MAQSHGIYFRAVARTEKIWLIVSLLKTFDNIAYHRTIDNSSNIMEFSVPEGMLSDFLLLMGYCQRENLIEEYHEAASPYV